VHYCPTNRLFSDLVDRWKASVGPSLGKSTFQHYCNALRAYVLPYFKDHQFQAITNEEIQKFINQQAKRYSASSLYGVSGWHDPEAPAAGQRVCLSREVLQNSTLGVERAIFESDRAKF